MAAGGAVREGLDGRLSVRVHIPGALRQWSGGNELIELALPRDASVTLADIFETLARDYPGIRQRVLDDQGDLRRHVNVFIDGDSVRFAGGLAAQVGPDSEIRIHPALSGGH